MNTFVGIELNLTDNKIKNIYLVPLIEIYKIETDPFNDMRMHLWK